MFVPVGFAIAVSLDPEILMVDEVIAVGDEESFSGSASIICLTCGSAGATIVLVTHSLGLIRDLCDRAMWLEHGRIKQLGPATEVADAYIADVNAREVQAHQASTIEENGPGRRNR